MEFVDVPQQLQQVNYKAHPQYQVILNSQTLPHNPNIRNIPRNIMPNTMAQSDLKNQILKLTSNAMSPLSLNIGSPMYSLPSSPNTPNYSPAMSPAPKDRVLSPYSTPQSLSPVGYSQPPSRIVSPGPIQGGDPYLNIKMQPSPNFMQNDLLMDSNMPIASPDFWPDEMMQTSDLLSAFDDVKLG